MPSFRKNGIIHDATGYLRYCHGIGPGYKCLDTGDMKDRLTPINGIFYGFKLPKADLRKYRKWKRTEVKNTIEEIKGESIMNVLLDRILIVILIIGCYLFISIFM